MSRHRQSYNSTWLIEIGTCLPHERLLKEYMRWEYLKQYSKRGRRNVKTSEVLMSVYQIKIKQILLGFNLVDRSPVRLVDLFRSIERYHR